MTGGSLILIVTAALIYFGIAQRVLDKMQLTDTQALVFILLMILGSFLTIPIQQGITNVALNVGGLLPVGLVLYLFVKADTNQEKIRAALASIVTAAIIFTLSQLTDFDPSSRFLLIDPLWLFSIVAGLVGYLSGRSRRASFIAGVLGIFLVDVVHLIRANLVTLPTNIVLGGAGVFDSMIVAGLIAVLLGELVGEIRERIETGGGE